MFGELLKTAKIFPKYPPETIWRPLSEPRELSNTPRVPPETLRRLTRDQLLKHQRLPGHSGDPAETSRRPCGNSTVESLGCLPWVSGESSVDLWWVCGRSSGVSEESPEGLMSLV